MEQEKITGIIVTCNHADLLFNTGVCDIKSYEIKLTNDQLEVINKMIKSGYSVINLSLKYESPNS